tara:strand:+ start:600 stop:2105 length:1506 start_codon:yes stop_codon:yes gene_type:complete
LVSLDKSRGRGRARVTTRERRRSGLFDPALAERYRIILLAALLAACAMLGGASRTDVLAHMPLRILSIVVIFAALWSPNFVRMNRYRPLFVIFGLALAIPLAQSIPLPHGLWAAIPGHGFYADIIKDAGLMESWRPISLTPTLTFNAFLAMLVPLAALVVASQIEPERLPLLLVMIVVLAAASMLLGYAQAAGGPASALRFYRVTNPDSMVGFFANRNHHALLIAMALPVMCVLGVTYRDNPTWKHLGAPLMLGGVGIMLVTLLLTGSRAGLLVGALGLLAGAWLAAAIFQRQLQSHGQGGAKRAPRGNSAMGNRLTVLIKPTNVLLLAGAGIAVVALLFANSATMQRLIRTDGIEGDRLSYYPAMWELFVAHFPFGTGLGGFSTIYRRFEVPAELQTAYLNHAHNDPFQIGIEAGIFGLIVLALFVLWWLRAAFKIWRGPVSRSFKGNIGRLASVMTAMAMLASLVDYPMRTPIHAVVFIILCVVMHRAAGSRSAAASQG